MAFDAYQEHVQHVEGSFANEFQAAFANSRATQQYPKQQPLVDAVTAKGRFALVAHYDVYCRYTDATLGSAVVLISDHATRDEAQAAYLAKASEDDSPEFYYAVEGPAAPAPPAAPKADFEDGVPF